MRKTVRAGRSAPRNMPSWNTVNIVPSVTKISPMNEMTYTRSKLLDIIIYIIIIIIINTLDLFYMDGPGSYIRSKAELIDGLSMVGII